MLRLWRLAIFDWNGTLLDDAHIAYLGVRKIFEHFRLVPPTPEEYRNKITSDIVTFYYERGVPRETTYEDLNRIFKIAVEENWDIVQLCPFARMILEYCSRLGIPRVIVSAERPEFLARRLSQFNLESTFSETHTGAYNKKLVFEEILKRRNIEASECVYVDDTVGGIRAAKELGIVTVGYTGGYNSASQLAEAKPDFLINSLFDLVRILNNA